MAYTTLRLHSSTKKELEALKNFKKESYEDVIERLIANSKQDSSLDAGEIRQIEKSLNDIKSGRVLSLEDAEKEWGI